MTPKRTAKKSAPPVKSTFKKARQPATPVERKVIAYVQRKNPAMMEITMALRILIKKTVPTSRELLNPWGLPTYEWRGAIGYIMVGKKHVTFGFARGSELPDPAKLLEGTGKNLRHVKIRRQSPAPRRQPPRPHPQRRQPQSPRPPKIQNPSNQ